jgi:predicted enzyme related to lactoylglutathione lyase
VRSPVESDLWFGTDEIGLRHGQGSPRELDLRYNAGPGRDPLPYPVVHFEVGCHDLAKISEFSSKLFDWTIQQESLAAMIRTGDGIGGHISVLGHKPHNYVMFCVAFDDVGTYLNKATALGGKALLPIIQLPTGEFSWLSDPEGNIPHCSRKT